MRAGTRFAAGLAMVVAVGAIAAIPAGAASKAPVAKSTSCELTQSETQNGLGASYVYTLNVKGISCEKGKKLVLKFHECRHDNGGRDGTCNGVKGYSCNTKILDEAPTQFSAKATCKKGAKKFKQTFGEST